MSNSSLVTYVDLSPHFTPRRGKISKITIHHMAGNLSVETCGRVFHTREASANYGIDGEGNIGLYVDESNRAWSTANPPNDHIAINIELANDGGAPDWHVSDTAIERCIDLCVDICKRNGIKSLNYTGDRNGNLTRHDMFIDTTCPGPYLASKYPYIAEQVNTRLGASTSTTKPNTNTTKKEMCNVEVPILRQGDKSGYVKTCQILLNKYFNAGLDEDGKFGPATYKAVVAYQRDRHLDADGIIGPATWKQLCC